MKKRMICNLLVLALLLGLLPTAVLAGGGSQIVWSDDLSDSDAWDAWTKIDANNDGFTWNRITDIDESGGGCAIAYYAASPVAIAGEDAGDCSDDYLISPPIELAGTYNEFELTFDAKMIQGNGAPPYTYGMFYVIDADEPTDAYSIRAVPHRRYDTVVPYPGDGWTPVRYDLTAYAGKTVRLVFHHKDPAAGQLRLDHFQITEYEPDSHVERICITGVPEPEIGLGVKNMRESSIVIHDTTNLSLVPGTLKYYRIVDEQSIPQSGGFEEGAEYDLRFDLRVKEGAFTYTNAIASVNGRHASVLLDDKGTGDTSDDIISVYYYYGNLRAEKKPVEYFSAFVTPPVAGKTPANDVAVVQGPVEVTYAYWCLMKDEEVAGPALYPNETFSVGQTYRCYFYVKPKAGNYFEEAVRYNVNDEVHSQIISEPEEEALFHVDFTARTDASCTVRFNTEYGDTPADVSGTVGSSIHLPVLPDQPDAKFCGWGYHPYGAEEDLLPADFRITHSCTLYAFWQDYIDAPAVAISTEGLYRPATASKAVVDRFVPYSAVELAEDETVAWWNEQSQLGIISQRYRIWFENEIVYYGMAILEADKDHCFSADAHLHLQFSGAVLDKVTNTGRQLRMEFHMQIPGLTALDEAELCVPTLIPGSPVNETSAIPVYSLTPGVRITPMQGVWKEKADVGESSKAWKPGFTPGATFYAECVLEATGAMTFGPDLKLTIDGAAEISRYSVGEYADEIGLIYAVKIPDTHDFEASVRSTNGTYPCGCIRTDYHAEWGTWIEGPYTRGGEHWIKAQPEPGYTFKEWRSKDGSGQLLSTENPYFYTLDKDLAIEAVFAASHTVTFLNAHGDMPAPQLVPEGALATEPKGLTATDFLFRGWYTDPACAEEDKYDFSTPVTGDLILYSGWKYAPGMNTDKALLNQCIAEAETLDTSYYTDESVAVLQQAITAAKEVQADPAVSQDTVDGVLDDLNDAVFGLVLKSGAVDMSALDQAIADAEALDTSCYTIESVTALAMTLTGARMVRSASGATQDDVDMALENIKSAVAGLEVRPDAVDKNALNKAIAEAEAIDRAKCFAEDAEALEYVLAKGREARDNASDQAAVDAAAKALREVIDPVKARIRTWDDFLAAVEEAESYKEEDYTPESFAQLKEALETAHSVTTDAQPGIIELTMKMATEALKEAIARLDKKDTGELFRFDDVCDESMYYFAPVYWAYKATPQITNGIDTTHFGPDRGCTRGQVVTFLWRTAGCPEPDGTVTGFSDVAPGAFYEKAVTWAVEKKITNGVSSVSFAPDATCTRGQIVTFLWRFRGESASDGTKNPFTDVKDGTYYYNAVLWAVEHGVTNGTTPTTFGPDLTCTRGQIVTFLKRAVDP